MNGLAVLDFAAAGGAGRQPPAPRGFVLHPGDVALAFAGDGLETLLGSCVALVLTDPRRTVAVMCHIVHSMDPPPARGGDTRFAGPALDASFALLRSAGLSPALCHAYLFGGGNMFPDRFSARHVGAENVRWTRDCLTQLGVRVCGESVGGASYRKIGWTVGTEEPRVISVQVAPRQNDAPVPVFGLKE
jgi:chemotaxis protein CheD